MFSQKLKELRLNKNYTQEYVGKILHVSYKTVGAWERGTRQPTVEAIQGISKLFGVSTDYLLDRENKTSNNSDEKDLKDFLDQNLEKGMTYADKELTEEDKERLKIALTQVFWKYHKKD
ncbi:helix-turn-helix domain-containing protein [Ligilactobacillus sp. WILCCON 0076]|uniref:Helix-turn-helix domain-containing protein n=1 Tax=Ligilactobacillus ubinensis TaxID=2876789 RepID=A0A9X2JMC3_9LACO|nr:helix-turn-helix domain-containing protein [Ligilactobacillus ubinensis]MCP0886966.1 helix-turn-helix domain-containing protein [Ligilactobacillus ubinensis]